METKRIVWTPFHQEYGAELLRMEGDWAIVLCRFYRREEKVLARDIDYNFEARKRIEEIHALECAIDGAALAENWQYRNELIARYNRLF